MNRRTITIDPVASKLRRVGRVARRRMRIDGEVLHNGLHSDGTLTVEISGLGSPVAGVPELFEWQADRPVALVIIRSGRDGEEVSFQVGPARSGIARGAGVGDGSGIRYVAFCYDAAPDATAVRAPSPRPSHGAVSLGAAVSAAPAASAAAVSGDFRTTGRERRSILSLFLQGGAGRLTNGSLA